MFISIYSFFYIFFQWALNVMALVSVTIVWTRLAVGTADGINLSDFLRLGFSKYYFLCVLGCKLNFQSFEPFLWHVVFCWIWLFAGIMHPITRRAFVYVQMKLQLMVFMLPVTLRHLLKKPEVISPTILCNSVPNFSNWSRKAEILAKTLYLAMKYPYDIINGKWTTADDAFCY